MELFWPIYPQKLLNSLKKIITNGIGYPGNISEQYNSISCLPGNRKWNYFGLFTHKNLIKSHKIKVITNGIGYTGVADAS